VKVFISIFLKVILISYFLCSVLLISENVILILLINYYQPRIFKSISSFSTFIFLFTNFLNKNKFLKDFKDKINLLINKYRDQQLQYNNFPAIRIIIIWFTAANPLKALNQVWIKLLHVLVSLNCLFSTAVLHILLMIHPFCSLFLHFVHSSFMIHPFCSFFKIIQNYFLFLLEINIYFPSILFVFSLNNRLV